MEVDALLLDVRSISFGYVDGEREYRLSEMETLAAAVIVLVKCRWVNYGTYRSIKVYRPPHTISINSKAWPLVGAIAAMDIWPPWLPPPSRPRSPTPLPNNSSIPWAKRRTYLIARAMHRMLALLLRNPL